MLDRLGDRCDIDDLTVTNGANRKRDLPEAMQSRRSLADRQLGGANAGGPDVETDRVSSHWSVLPRQLGNATQTCVL
jgi:hypothetical protein